MSVAEQTPPSETVLAGAAEEWWRGAVIYQVYPRSFLDTDGNGVGDLNGVTEKLDYIARLGVDGVWLSPFFKSPMRDFGYDVSDYRNVDPIFGSLDDFNRLVETAHRLGLKVIIDQVYSHTSDLHAWFYKSRQSKTNDKADWYVWADAKEDGAPPNNWLSVFGGGAWTWDSRREQYYFHNFLSSQPDLNLHNRDVQDALLDVARFWLDRGVDGFRLDAINFAMHDPQLRDNPPAPRDGRTFKRPFDFQDHIYNRSHPDIPKFLERLRRVTNEYPGVFTVAEVGGPTPLQEMKAFSKGGNRLNSAYNFDFLYANDLTPGVLKQSLGAWPNTGDEGWPSWAFSNHDAPRAVSRWRGDTDAAHAAKLYAMLLLSLRGNVFLYQGEELGLPQADISFEDLKDPEAIANWPLTLGRDGARTPMPWQGAAAQAGFSSTKPWLPIPSEHLKLAAGAQENDPSSVLNFVRNLISLRCKSAELLEGSLEFCEAPENGLAFWRRKDGRKALCVFNLGDTPLSWTVPDSASLQIVASLGLGEDRTPPASLPAQSGYIATAVS